MRLDMELSKLFKDRYFLLLGLCVFLAVVLSFRYLLSQTVFGYDMARDAFYAYDIYHNHDFKILGPGTDIVGLNHGVLWYYILSIPYFLSQQDPQLAVIFFFILSISTIPFVWLLSEELFGDRRVSFVSVVLYSFSPIFIPMSSWMSNPILCLYASPPLLLLIYRYSKNPSFKKSFLIGLLYGLLIQSQLANIILLASIPFFLILLKIKFKVKDISFFLVGFLTMISTFILVELKFKGRGVISLIEYLHKGHGGNLPRNDFILGKFIEFFQVTIFPFDDWIVGLLSILVGFGILIVLKSNKKAIAFLLVWILNVFLFTLFDTGVSHSQFVFIPIVAAGIILFSYLLTNIFRFRFIIFLSVIILVLFQVNTIESWRKEEFSPAAIQKSNTVRRYKQVVDYTYSEANGRPFVLDTLTTPLYINTVWEYLYGFYGKEKYGYEPYWGGRSQEGFQHLLTSNPYGSDLRFLVLESSIGMDAIYPFKAKYDEDRISDVVEEKHFGNVTVQKRIFHKDKGPIEIPEILKNSQVLYE